MMRCAFERRVLSLFVCPHSSTRTSLSLVWTNLPRQTIGIQLAHSGLPVHPGRSLLVSDSVQQRKIQCRSGIGFCCCSWCLASWVRRFCCHLPTRKQAITLSC